MNEILLKKLDIIKRSAELLLEHTERKAFKNTYVEVALKNILSTAVDAIEEIKEEKAPESPHE